MNEFTCKICGKQVSKRHSLHVGNNERACREHPETQALADKAHGVIKAQHEATAKKWEQKENVERYRNEPWDPRPKCMVCEAVGLRSDEWFTRLLIEHQKYEMTTGKAAFSFDPKEMQEMKGSLKDVACLFPFELNLIKERHIRLTRIGWQVAQMLNYAFICADCVAKLKLPNPMPQPTFEQLEHMMLVAELMKPTLQKMASDELARDQ